MFTDCWSTFLPWICPVVSGMHLYFLFSLFLYYTCLEIMRFTGVFGKKPTLCYLREACFLIISFIFELWEIPDHCDFSSMVSFVVFIALHHIASSSHLLAKLKGLVSFWCGRFPIHLMIPVLLCSFLDLWYRFWDGLTKTAFFCDVGTWGF